MDESLGLWMSGQESKKHQYSWSTQTGNSYVLLLKLTPNSDFPKIYRAQSGKAVAHYTTLSHSDTPASGNENRASSYSAHFHYRFTRALSPAINASTSSTAAIVVSPCVVIAKAP